MLFDTPIEKITVEDILALKENCESEGKFLDYKESPPGNSDDYKYEFRADVSSFANTSGGDLVFGVKEAGGVPVEIAGLDLPATSDIDKEILRLISIYQSSILPRLSGIDIRTFVLESGRPILLLRVPRSWNRPHAVVRNESMRFFARNPAGKFPLDLTEVRSLIVGSEAIGERTRNFRTERLAVILDGATPAPSGAGAKLVLHVVPWGAFQPGAAINLKALKDVTCLWPIVEDYPPGSQFNFDGIIFPSHRKSLVNHKSFDRYVQFFRNGAVEAVDDYVTTAREHNEIWDSHIEIELRKAVTGILARQHAIGVAPPLSLMVSLLGVRHCAFLRSSTLSRGEFDRDNLLLPDVAVESFEVSPDTILRPIFDVIQQSAGFDCSPNYNSEGKWIGKSS